MELPKNITQIGEVSKDCKVYAEDYVISYLKQLNQTARDKETAAALYGRRSEENGISYFFLYGACQLTLLQRETRHLSQAQYQEIERLRRKFFPDYVFLGYRLLDGEMIEGFHICEQEICRYIAGYAQFYEKNDPMLTYMLEVRREIEPEIVDQEKYNEVKKRQEERRAATEGQLRQRRREENAGRKKADRQHSMPPSRNLQRMRIAVAGVFVLLCLSGFLILRKESGQEKDLQASARKWIDGLLQQQLPDNGELLATSGNVAQKDVLVMEDKLEQALREENQTAAQTGDLNGKEQKGQADDPDGTGQTKQDDDRPETGQEDPAAAQTGADRTEGTEIAGNMPETDDGNGDTDGVVPTDGPVTETVPKMEAVAYVIQTGDTLIGISRRQYGSENHVADICSVNKITNPDDIKVGQVIMLPQ